MHIVAKLVVCLIRVLRVADPHEDTVKFLSQGVLKLFRLQLTRR